MYGRVRVAFCDGIIGISTCLPQTAITPMKKLGLDLKQKLHSNRDDILT